MEPGLAQIAAGGRRDRRRALRAAARHGALAPAFAVLYVLVSGHENRPAMLAVATFLLAIALGVSLATDRLAHWSKLRSFSLFMFLFYVAGYAVLSYFDGGVAGPLGDVVLFIMVFTAIAVPFRQFVVVGIAAVTAYLAVAILGPTAPPWYAAMCGGSFVVVSILMARHARALASLGRRLTEMSRIDPLTGCLNRRGFDERLTDEVSRTDRTGQPFTLLMVDLDSFKAVNDTYGHHVGDDLLTWTGHTLRETLDAADAVGRLGGDEFAVILTDVDTRSAEGVIEPCRAALNGASPASMGRASYPQEAADLRALLRLADQRLYEEKAQRVGVGVPTESAITTTVAAASTEFAPVSAFERRRWSIADTGWIASVNFGIGVVYGASQSGAVGSTVLALLIAGFAIGVFVVATASVMARSPSVGPIMGTVGTTLFGLAIVAATLDGGVDSVIALGMLNPLLVISLTAPRRMVLPLGTIVAACYVGMGLLVGAPSNWYIATHVAGTVVISLMSVHLGGAAARRRRQLTHLSRVDGLTGCLNRRGFEERFTVEMRRSADVSVLVLDLDEFKAINDDLGHAAGDELLCWVSASIAEAVRAHDLVGRLGGDEFIAMLSDCPADEATVIADRIRASLSSRIAVSIGAATLGQDGNDLDSLYRHADAALFVEKSRHRSAPRCDLFPLPEGDQAIGAGGW